MAVPAVIAARVVAVLEVVVEGIMETVESDAEDLRGAISWKMKGVTMENYSHVDWVLEITKSYM